MRNAIRRLDGPATANLCLCVMISARVVQTKLATPASPMQVRKFAVVLAFSMKAVVEDGCEGFLGDILSVAVVWFEILTSKTGREEELICLIKLQSLSPEIA